MSSSREDLREGIARLDRATDRLRNGQGDAGENSALAAKIDRFSHQVSDLDKTVDDLSSSINIERELTAAKELREAKAAIQKRMLEEERAAEKRYNEAINLAKAEAEAVEQTLRVRRIEEEKLERLKAEVEARRKARESAELTYHTDLSATVRRLRELELDLEQTRTSVSTAYERRRLHDSLRRIRLSRLSLGEQLLDYDYCGRRLGSVLDAPSLYTGVASRAYDLYPYYRYTRSYYPYYSPYYSSYYGYPYSRYYTPVV